MQFTLTDGNTALIDERDAHLIALGPWHFDDRGYVVFCRRESGKRVKHYLHREVMGNPLALVDHRNRVKNDCQRHNLRLGTKSLNAANGNFRRDPKKLSRFKGVTWDAHAGKWKAQIAARYIGIFTSEEDAAAAYDAEAVALYGEFAATNK